MKTYKMRPGRGPECPIGQHEPYGSGPGGCPCAWLVIESGPEDGNNIIHFSRRELQNLVKYADEGYFDPADYPMRKASLFISPYLHSLLELAQRDPAAAAMRLISTEEVNAIDYDQPRRCLSFQFGNSGWWQLWLPEHETDTCEATYSTLPGGDDPQPVWRRPTTIEGYVVNDPAEASIREQVRRQLGSNPDWRAYVPGELTGDLVDDEPAEPLEPAADPPAGLATVAELVQEIGTQLPKRVMRRRFTTPAPEETTP